MADTLISLLTRDTNGTATVITTADTATKTVLSISICNVHATDSITLDMYYRDASDANFRIYNDIVIPALSTFIHNSKIVLPSQCELVLDQTTTVNGYDVVTSWLNQTA